MVFARAEEAQEPRSDAVKIVAWIYVAVLVVMVVVQLVDYSNFILLLSSTYSLLHIYGTAVLVSCLIAMTEVFAVPALLRMPLSPLMRWFSLTCGFISSLLWLVLSAESIGSTIHSNSGLLGTKVSIPLGWPSLIVSVILVVFSAYSVWGLLPLKKK